jgi:hypothetical protein
MAEVINLRLVRKSKARSAKESAAEANRALHGETGAARKAREAEAARAATHLDGAKRERD